MNTRLFVTIATAALILAGCTNDENGTDNGPVKIRLTSGVEVQQPRASTTLTQSTSITAGEVVSVWVDDAGTMSDPTPLYEANQLIATAQNGFSGSDMFFPKTGNKVNIYAIHGNFITPFTAGDALPTAAGVEYKVEADQSEGGAAYTNSDLLYAYKKDVSRNGNPTEVQLTFYHMLSKLELAIVKGEGAPELAPTGAVKLNGVTLKGNFTPSTSVDMSDQSKRADMLKAITPSSNEMTLGQNTCADFTDHVIYNEAILVPQDMIDKVLTFTLADGGTLKYTIKQFSTTSGKAVFESGKKYQYHITLKLTGLEVTSKIEDWEAVGGDPVKGDAVMD